MLCGPLKQRYGLPVETTALDAWFMVCTNSSKNMIIYKYPIDNDKRGKKILCKYLINYDKKGKNT